MNTFKGRVKIYAASLLVALWGIMVINDYIVTRGTQFGNYGTGANAMLMAQANLKTPQIASNASYSALSVKWTAGTVNNGGHSVTVSAGSGALTALQNDCSAPLYNACNIVWANSSGTVTVTAATSGIATASAYGNTILGFVETSQSAITKLSYANQASTVVNPAAWFSCTAAADCSSSPTASGYVRRFYWSGTVASGSAVTLYSISPAWQSTSTYGCSAVVVGTTSSLVVASVNKVSTSSVKVFVAVPTGSASETVNLTCAGY